MCVCVCVSELYACVLHVKIVAALFVFSVSVSSYFVVLATVVSSFIVLSEESNPPTIYARNESIPTT